MKMAKKLLKALNSLTDLAVILAILLTGAYSAYALWDNHRIYAAADSIQTDMRRLKPEPDAEQSGDSFEKLREINPDVCAWITLEHTGIDYPVLQGKDNLCYINTDVYGGFALAGSIFLDSRSDRAFGDAFSLLYGHHMENGRMFGDLDRYREDAFFSENRTGVLLLPEGRYDLEIFACLLIPASDETVFSPQTTGAAELLDRVSESAVKVHPEVIDRLRESEEVQILGLSTCASEFTDARTVVLAVMQPGLPVK